MTRTLIRALALLASVGSAALSPALAQTRTGEIPWSQANRPGGPPLLGSSGALVLQQLAIGSTTNSRGLLGATCLSSGQFSTPGDAQTCAYTLRGSTNSATAVQLTADGNAAGSTNCINIPLGLMYGLDIHVVARDTTTGGAWAEWRQPGSTLVNDSTGLSFTADMGFTTTAGSGSNAVLSIGPDTVHSCLSISFQAPNSDAWHVIATVLATEG